jgi:hypothetical protein
VFATHPSEFIAECAICLDWDPDDNHLLDVELLKLRRPERPRQQSSTFLIQHTISVSRISSDDEAVIISYVAQGTFQPGTRAELRDLSASTAVREYIASVTDIGTLDMFVKEATITPVKMACIRINRLMPPGQNVLYMDLSTPAGSPLILHVDDPTLIATAKNPGGRFAIYVRVTEETFPVLEAEFVHLAALDKKRVLAHLTPAVKDMLMARRLAHARVHRSKEEQLPYDDFSRASGVAASFSDLPVMPPCG